MQGNIAGSLVILAFVGCGDAKDAPTATATPAAPLEIPGSVAELTRVCDGKGFADSPAYVKGKTPSDDSPIAFLVKYTDEAKPEYRGAEPDGILASGMQQPSQTQLVVCVEMKSDGTDGGVCDDRPAHHASGTLTVREARTAKVLATSPLKLRNGPICMTDKKDRAWSKDRSMPSFMHVALEHLTPLRAEGTKKPDFLAAGVACQGAPVMTAAPYEKGKPTRILIQYTDANGRGAPPPSPLPFTSASTKHTPEIGLVACVRARPEKLLKTCEFKGKSKLDLYDGSFDVEIVEARTAKVVEKKSFKAGPQETVCPEIRMMKSDNEKTIDRADKSIDAYIRSFGEPAPKE